MVLICYVILQGQVTKGSSNFMGRSRVSHHPVKFGRHRHCSNGEIAILVCHLILHDHVTKGSSNIISRIPSSKSLSCQV